MYICIYIYIHIYIYIYYTCMYKFTALKMYKYGVISGLYFPIFGLNTEIYTDKYGP